MFWHHSHPQRFATMVRRGALACGTLTLAVALIGCQTATSDDQASAPAGSSTDTEALAALTAAITEWPAAPSDAVPAPSGLRFVTITCGSTGVTCVRGADGVSAAAEHIGASNTVIDGKSDAAVWSSAIQNAIGQHVDGIILSGVPAAAVAAAVADAQAAGIPIVQTLQHEPCEVDACVDIDRDRAAQYAAKFVAIDSDGTGQVLQLGAPEFPETVVYNDTFTASLAAECTGCTITEQVEFSFASIGDRLAGEVASALQVNPAIAYIEMPFDTIVPFVQQGIAQSGRSDVKVIGLGADPVGIDAIRDGIIAATPGNPAEWQGWQATDAILRLRNGQPVSNTLVPSRLVTADTLPSGDAGWQGDLDFTAFFTEVWQLS